MNNTRRQTRLAKELLNPANKTVREAAIKAGYSPKSINPYKKAIKSNIAELLAKAGVDKESLREYFKELSTLAIATKDLSNANRSGENIARLYAHFTDKQQIDAHVVSEQEEAILNRFKDVLSTS